MSRAGCRLLLAAAVAAGGLAAQNAEEDFLRRAFARWDPDGDGRVRAAEFPGSTSRFEELDRDADNHISFAEFRQSATARQLLDAKQRNDAAPRRRADPDRLVLRRLRAARRYDANRDGRITRGEWPGLPAHFTELDLDGDGRLDTRDLRIAERRAPPAEAPRLPELPRRPPPVDDLLAARDRDGDGQLSDRELRGDALHAGFAWADRNGDDRLDRRELVRLVRAVRARLTARNRGDARPRAYRVPFSAWDSDDDGRLQAAEWRERKHLFARIDQDRDAAVTRTEIERYRRAVEGTTFFERFDLDGDGRVTRAEFGGPPAAFRRADTNGDGVITRAD